MSEYYQWIIRIRIINKNNNTHVIITTITSTTTTTTTATTGLSREVNIAMGTPTSWRTQLFRSSTDVMEVKPLLCGSQIYFRDPEHDTYLTGMCVMMMIVTMIVTTILILIY